MIEELLKADKISRFDYLVYALFECNEFGREFFSNMLIDTFMEEPLRMESGGIKLAFIDGRRSVFRDIRRALFTVKQKLQEVDNDYGQSNSTQ